MVLSFSLPMPDARLKDVAAELRVLQEVSDQRDDRLTKAVAKVEAACTRLESATAHRLELVERSVADITGSLEGLYGRIESLLNPHLLGKGVLGSHTESGSSSTPPRVKLHFPRFDGSDPLSWIFKADQYFSFYDTPDDQRILLASVHFEGDVVPWFQMLQRVGQCPSWVALTRAIEQQYGPTQFDNPRAQLFKLEQLTSVTQYHTAFTVLANRVVGLSDEALLDCFISGLKKEIKRDVLAREPTSLPHAVALAKLYDVGIPTLGSSSRSRAGSTVFNSHKQPSTALSSPLSHSVGVPTAPPLLPTPPGKPSPQIRRLSAAEIQQRREQGLCYNCDEKFSATHRCQNRRFMLLMLDDDDSGEASPDVGEESHALDESVLLHHMSLQAFSGTLSPCTIRFDGQLCGSTVSVLLDGGSSDNFIQPRVVDHLHLVVEDSPKFKVLVGDGYSLLGQGVVRAIPLRLSGHEIPVDVFVAPIKGADIVLGASWLATLGAHVADYSIAMLRIYRDGQFLTLQGCQHTLPIPMQYNHMRRCLLSDGVDLLYALEFNVAEKCTLAFVLPENTPPDLGHLLTQFADVFGEPKGLPPVRPHEHSITLIPGAGPVKVRPYRYPFSQKNQIELMVDDMLREGIIQPSLSPFSAPVLLVRKKDGSWRFCTDYRALNAVTIKDSYPLPTVDELLDELFGAHYFSKLDLRSGYHQIRVRQEDQSKTAFRTHNGHYEWLVMPFGLTNAPATFQAVMNAVFQPYLRKFVLVFFDDILIYSADWETHLSHLAIVLTLLRTHVLFAKLSKCSFGVSKIDYLGHIVSSQGVEMDGTKLIAINDWPIPSSVTQLRGFLGLTGYYRRFIRGYATIAAPLTSLLQKNSFLWSAEAEAAFLALKRAVTEAPVLRLPDFSQPFVVEADASGLGIGAVLSQKGHPIAFFSRKLSTRMQHKSAYVREMFAITEAIAKFRHYLVGHKFVIRTDHQSIRHMTDQIIQTPEQQEWLPKLLGYDFTIEYKPGRTNLVADALSRSCYMAVSTPVTDWLSDLIALQQDDERLRDIILQIMQRDPKVSSYQFQRGILLFKNRLVVPTTANAFIRRLLEEFHSSPVGGHSGFLKTFQRVRRQFFWHNMKKDIQSFIRLCDVCQRAKSSQTSPAGLLQPLPIPMAFGRMLPWISLLVYRNPVVTLLSWWLLIALPNMVILRLLLHPIQLFLWPRPSFRMWCAYMVYRSRLSLIVIGLLLVHFGSIYSSYRGLHLL